MKKIILSSLAIFAPLREKKRVAGIARLSFDTCYVLFIQQVRTSKMKLFKCKIIVQKFSLFKKIIFIWALFLFLSNGNFVFANPEYQFDMSGVISSLGGATEEFDRLDEVRESAWIRTDRSRVERRINDYLDTVIEHLETPGMLELRQRYQALEDTISSDQDRISDFREARLSAPEGDPSLTRYIPTQTMRQWTARTRGDFDALIAAYQRSIQAHQKEMRKIEAEMSGLLSGIGVDLDPEGVEFWLSSAVGDDIMSMSIVFANVSVVTNQLAELTRESGENLAYARRYYGMVVMLHKLAVKMQSDFIHKANEEVLPRLREFDKEADKNIEEARLLMRQVADRTSLESNIKANEMTKEVITLYRQVVNDHRDQVAKALNISKQEKRVAINTYNTVRLSSDVNTLIRQGLSTFNALSQIQLPAAQTFENNELREEFRRLTERMKMD
ncbi:hypothetical protein [Desulfonatronospira sp.]|uniref:hypothetical protein n=1 Tax=Desulfonatronospira sp. TaxID=1962951 RepID=UPI0025C71135|nr:hypothetical protein [Desulfonatronospira sp.]